MDWPFVQQPQTATMSSLKFVVLFLFASLLPVISTVSNRARSPRSSFYIYRYDLTSIKVFHS